MKTVDYLYDISTFIACNKLPLNHIMVLNTEDKKEWDKVLMEFGSSGVQMDKIPNTDTECESFIFGRVKFFFVDVETWENTMKNKINA